MRLQRKLSLNDVKEGFFRIYCGHSLGLIINKGRASPPLRGDLSGRCNGPVVFGRASPPLRGDLQGLCNDP